MDNSCRMAGKLGMFLSCIVEKKREQDPWQDLLVGS